MEYFSEYFYVLIELFNQYEAVPPLNFSSADLMAFLKLAIRLF